MYHSQRPTPFFFLDQLLVPTFSVEPSTPSVELSHCTVAVRALSSAAVTLPRCSPSTISWSTWFPSLGNLWSSGTYSFSPDTAATTADPSNTLRNIIWWFGSRVIDDLVIEVASSKKFRRERVPRNVRFRCCEYAISENWKGWTKSASALFVQLMLFSNKVNTKWNYNHPHWLLSVGHRLGATMSNSKIWPSSQKTRSSFPIDGRTHHHADSLPQAINPNPFSSRISLWWLPLQYSVQRFLKTG